MGICWSNEKETINCISKNTEINNRNNLENIELPIEKFPSIDNSFEESLKQFPDFPIWDNNKLSGYGIKQMPAYKCDLKTDELNKKIEEFWRSKKNKGKNWLHIHQACVFDHVKAEEYLFTHHLKTIDGCINMIVDEEGKVYRIPNYCINEPHFEMEILPEEDSRNKLINITLFDVTNQKQIKIKVSENTTGKEMMERYAAKHNIDLATNKIRLLFGGTLIKENEHLYQHKIKNHFSIQICITKII